MVYEEKKSEQPNKKDTKIREDEKEKDEIWKFEEPLKLQR